jgi:hypothetical protein
MAVLLSYGAAAFLAIAGLAAIGLGRARGASPRSLLAPLGTAGAVAVLVFLAPRLVGHHPFESARVALTIHREYFTAPRQYGVWLFFNLVDAALFVGPPVALAFAMRLVAVRGRARAYALGAAGGLGVLLISGVTRGEVGRLWIPLMPVFLAPGLAASDTGDGEAPTARDATLLAALLVVLDAAIKVSWQVPS